MSRIVHTKGGIARRGVAQGAICRQCPGGCKTDCQRAGVSFELSRFSNYDGIDSFEVDENFEFHPEGQKDVWDDWLDDY